MILETKRISIARTIFAFCLLSLALQGMGCGEACEKKYVLAGNITNASSSPLQDVEIRWVNTDNTLLGKTDASGNYSIPYTTRSNLENAQIQFVKSGFTTSNATAFSKEEAGPDKCGDITLTRNAALSP